MDIRPDLDTAMLFKTIRNKSSTPIVREPDEVAARPQPSRPGVVMLPLHFSGEMETADFAYGLHEEIIASLAAYKWFFVISAVRASSYGGKPVDVVSLASDLGVSYVLDGKLRRNGNRIRMRLNLSETRRGELLWSDTTDCFVDEALDAQSDFAYQIARMVEPEMLRGADDLRSTNKLADLDAWHLAARARRLAEQMTPQSLTQAEDAARQAIVKASDSAFGHAALAWILWLQDTLYEKDGAVLDDAVTAAGIAIDIDPQFFLGHAALGVNLLRKRDYDRSTVSLRRGLDLNPSYPATYNLISSCLTFNGKPHEALDYFEPLDRISPDDPYVSYYHCVRASAYFSVGDDVAAIKHAQNSLAEHPVWLTSELLLAAANQRLGKSESASAAITKLEHNHGNISISELKQQTPYRYDADFQILAEQLLAAGMRTK